TVENALFLKARESICSQYVSPQVAVVTCGITTGEKMAESVRETAPGWRRYYGNQFLDFCQSFEDFRSLIRAELGMEAEIEQAELQLAQNKQRRLVIFRCQHFIQQLFRQRLAGFIVTGDKRQRLRLPAPVFHKLARQFDRIPRHPTDPGNTSGFNAGQHMVQAVTELVEQGDHFVMGKQRRFTIYRAVEVAGQ